MDVGGLPIFLIDPIFPTIKVQLIHAKGNQEIFRLPLFLIGILVFHAQPSHYGATGGIIFIMLLSVVFNIFLTPGDVIVHFLIFTITKQGIIKGVYMAIRLVLLVVGTSVMTLTTTPNDLADGLEKSFGILNVIKFPVHEIAMVMSLALRFIPTLMEETDKITKAQKARGASFDTGNILQRAKRMLRRFASTGLLQ